MKKIICFFTSLAMLTGGMSINTAKAYEEKTYCVGDVNMDSVVDGTDATAILVYYAKASVGEDVTINEKLADVDHSGTINAVDSSQVLTMYAIASVGGYVKYELIKVREESERPQSVKSDFNIDVADLLQYNKSKVYVYNVPKEKREYLCEEKSVLDDGDTFVVLEVMDYNWYKISFYENGNYPKYIRITNSEQFKKIGKVISNNTTETTSTTSTSSTTTSTTTTSTTSTSSTTTSITSTSSTTTTEAVTSTSTSAKTTTSTESIVTSTMTSVNVVSNAKDFVDGSVMEFQRKTYYIHTKITNVFDEDVYLEKPFLLNGDRFIIEEVCGSSWYRISLMNYPTKNNLYVYIPEIAMEYFTKVGETIINVATSDVSLTTQTSTTTVSTTETSTTQTVSTTTGASTTTGVKTTINKGSVLILMADDVVYLHSSITSNPEEDIYQLKAFISQSEGFIIKQQLENNWYKVKLLSNEYDEVFVQITDEDIKRKFYVVLTN